MLLTEAYKFASSWFINPIVYFFSTLIQSSFLITLGTQSQDKKHSDLFPPYSQFVKLEAEEEKNDDLSKDETKSNNQDIAKPCSTSTMSMFVPIKNEAGEYEFKLANGSEENIIPYGSLRKGQLTPDSDVGIHNQPLSTNIDTKNGFINLSPVSSAKSTDSNNSLNLNTTTGESGDSEGNESSDGTEKMYQCNQCDSKFKCKSYLTRHAKKHSDQKAFRCPFYKEDNKCHQTGGFSRRDTFKTHLKSRHFEYPPGIKSSKRTGMMGWCGICGEKFLNNEIWVERHIDMGLCPGLPQEYIKTLKIGKKKTGKHSKFLDVSNVDESIKLGIQSYGRTDNDNNSNNNNTNGTIRMNSNMYLQSPSSVDSSPPNGLANNIPITQTNTTFASNTPKATTINSLAINSVPIMSGTPINLDYPMDAETILLLQKQQELTNIIIALKRKQDEAESRTLAAKQQYEQQMQNQLQFQMKQAQLQQQLMQLQQAQVPVPVPPTPTQVTDVQQLVRPQYFNSHEEIKNQHNQHNQHTQYADMSSTVPFYPNVSREATTGLLNNDGSYQYPTSTAAATSNPTTTATTEVADECQSDEEYPSLE